MPKTKEQPKYIGPYTAASEVTDSHVIISKDELGGKKDKKVPIHIAKPYFDRRDQSNQSRKRKTTAELKSVSNKHIKVNKSTYGFSKKSIINHISKLKEILKQNIESNTYMSPLHEELHNNKNIHHNYTPNYTLLKYLNDTTACDMKDYIMNELETWIEELFAEFPDRLKVKYADKVLLGVAYEYLNTIMWGTFPDYSSTRSIYKDDVKISLIDENWQREKCALLGLEFQSTIMQPTYMLGEELGRYQPFDTHKIVGDGNCLYRCLSALLTGSQDSHLELRSTIAHFIASEGATQMCSYFKGKQMTPCDYLTNSLNDMEGEWGTDVEIVAASVMLKTDIFVAMEFFPEGELHRRARWHLYTTCDANSEKNGILISNFGFHYEPVVSMICSQYPTYGERDRLDVTADS